MTLWTKRGVDIFAPTDAAGNLRKVINGEVQVWSREVEGAIDAAIASGALVYATKAELDTNLNHDAGTGAWVVGDTYALNGIYTKSGASGAGSWSRVSNLPSGPQGEIGGIAFSFDDGTTDADPGAGNIRANNADLSAATTLFVSKANRYANSVAAYLATLDDSTSSHKGYLILTAPDSETQATFSITALTDASSYVKLTVSGHSGATSFVDAERLVFQFSRTGNAGDLNGVSPGATGLELLEAETAGEAQAAIGLNLGTTGLAVLGAETAGDASDRMGIAGWYAIQNRMHLGEANNKIMETSAGQTLAIVCVGDSITYGYDNVSADILDPVPPHVTKRAAVQYPARLETRLSDFLRSSVTVENRGFSGDTAEASYNRWTDAPSADLAIIMFGINDSSDPIATYVEYMEKLIKRYIAWGCGVVLVTPTPVSMGNGNHASARYGQFARAIAAAYGCPVIEGMDLTIHAFQSEIYSDPTHFNSTGYAKIGDAVASFLMAGSLVREFRRVASETYVGPGRASEGIGVHIKNGTPTGNFTSSYVTAGSVCSLTAGSGKMAVSFYLDAEAAEVSTVGLLSTGTEVSMCTPYDNKGVNRGALKSFAGRQVRETEPYSVVINSNRRDDETQLGVVVGRGWKTVVLDATGASATAYVHGMIVRPVMQKDAISDGSEFTPAKESSLIFHVPPQERGGQVSAVAAVVMPQYLLVPIPDAMQSWAGLDGHYHWSLPVSVRVKRVGATPVGLTETAVVKSGSGANDYTLYPTFTSGAGAMAPTAVTFGWCAYQDDPVEYADLTIGSYPSGAQVLRFLVLEFPTESAAYHTVEVSGLARRGAPFTALN